MGSVTVLRRPAFVLALGLCAVGGMVTILGRLATGPQLEQRRHSISNGGAQIHPAFAPDGQRLAYAAREASKDATFHIWRWQVPDGKPQQLTTGVANDISPAWSPDGLSLAFLRVEAGRAQCAVMPAAGGDLRTLAEFPVTGDETQMPPLVAWTLDGKSLILSAGGEKQLPAISVVPLDGGGLRRITNPPEGSAGDSMPAVAPDGGTVAFVRSAGPDSADIFLCDLGGAGVRQLTFDGRAIRGLAWTRDGHDLVYAADRLRRWKLWRLPAYGGSPRDLLVAGREVQNPAIAPQGRRLAFTDSISVAAIWRADLRAPATVPEERAVIRSQATETRPVYSPDGKKIANVSEQTGFDEIWICDADGGNRAQVTNLKGPGIGRLRWSPDAKLLLFDADGDLYTIPAAAGAKPSRAVVGGSNASWSHDNQSIYYQMHGQIWKSAADGGNPQQLSRRPGAAQPVESADGKYVIYRSRRSIWRVPVEGGEEEEFIIPDRDMFSTTLQATKKGLYYMEFERSSRSQLVSFYDFALKKSSTVFRMRNAGFGSASYSVSPDGRYLLYSRVDQSQTNLVVVDNFR